jgi:hypothetical protein
MGGGLAVMVCAVVELQQLSCRTSFNSGAEVGTDGEVAATRSIEVEKHTEYRFWM